ncbi:MAG: hypothetical protein LBK76_12030 [Verrucomicrobiales bacterium]|nr:hypothetical protein [Verrucomicrobiales bacterium]
MIFNEQGWVYVHQGSALISVESQTEQTLNFTCQKGDFQRIKQSDPDGIWDDRAADLGCSHL